MPELPVPTALDTNAPFFVGAWQVRPLLNQLVREGETVRVEPKVMQVLVVLAQEEGQLVSQDRLLDAVWADTVVGRKVLSRAISELRKVFGDSRQQPHYIETIQKGGYRLIAPVSVDSPSTAPSVAQRSLLPPALLLVTVLVAAGMGLVWWGVQPARPASSPPAVVPFTTLQGSETYPALSPEGSRVAFAWQQPGATHAHLYLKQEGSETLIPLTDGEATDMSPSWSPDGSQLAFARHAQGTRALYVMPALGGRARKVYDCVANVASSLSWSPDGQALAFSDRAAPGAPLQVYLFSFDTGHATPLTTPPAGFVGDLDPAFSPSGNQVALVRAKVEGNHDVVVVDVRRETGHPVAVRETVMTDDGGFKLGMAWADDALVYATDDGLWRLDMPSQTKHRLSLPGGAVLFPSIQQNRMVYAEVRPEASIWRMPLGASDSLSPVPVIRSTRWDAEPAVSPDGTTLAFVSIRSGHPELWLSDAAGSQPVQQTQFGSATVRHPRWSPEGRALLFEVMDDGHSDLYQLDVASGAVTRLTTSEDDERLGLWSVDGQRVYYSSNQSGRWDLWKLDPATGTAQPWTTNGGFAAQPAPDGSGLYYTKADQDGLWYRAFDAPHERRVHAAPLARDWGHWALTPSGFYYLDRMQEVTPVLMFHAFEGQTDRAVASLPPTLLSNQHGLAVSPDGQWLYFSQQDRSDTDLMMATLVP